MTLWLRMIYSPGCIVAITMKRCFIMKWLNWYAPVNGNCHRSLAHWRQRFPPQVAVQRCRGGCHIIGCHMLLRRVADAAPAARRDGCNENGGKQMHVTAGRQRAAARQACANRLLKVESNSKSGHSTTAGPPAAHKEHAHARNICKHHCIMASAADQHWRCITAAALTAAVCGAAAAGTVYCCALLSAASCACASRHGTTAAGYMLCK